MFRANRILSRFGRLDYSVRLNLSVKIRDRILTEETIVELVTLVAEEIDAMAGELAGRLEVVEAELVVSHVWNRRDRAGGVSSWRPEC